MGHDSVFIVSTIPKAGFKARFDMPVLKEREVISSIAVPVVSEPVPAVVGIAMSGRKAWLIGSPFPTGAFMKSNRSASLYTVKLKTVGIRQVRGRDN